MVPGRRRYRQSLPLFRRRSDFLARVVAHWRLAARQGTGSERGAGCTGPWSGRAWRDLSHVYIREVACAGFRRRTRWIDRHRNWKITAPFRFPATNRWEGGMQPGLGNPLGARALTFYQDGKDTLYRIPVSPE